MITQEDVQFIQRTRSRGYSQREVAGRLGVSRDVIRYWESPERRSYHIQKRKELDAGPEFKLKEQERSRRRTEARKGARRERGLKYRDLSRPEGYSQSLWAQAKQHAMNRPELDLEWIYRALETGVCQKTGAPFNMDNPMMTPSVDRIVPGGPYTADNCQMILRGLNFAKNNSSESQLDEFLKSLTG